MAEKWHFKGTPAQIVENLRKLPSKSEANPARPGWLSDQEYRDIYNKVPRLCIDLIIFVNSDEQGRPGIVMTRREIEPYKGMWHLPGGGMRYGELVEETVSRLAKKELGVQASMGRIINSMEHPDEHDLGFGWPVSFVFEANIEGDLRSSTEGEVGVFTEIPENTIPSHRAFLETNYLFLKPSEAQ